MNFYNNGDKVYTGGDIYRLEQENSELKAQVEQLRLAAIKAISFMSGGEAKADLRDAYDSTPDQCLAEITNKARRDGYYYALVTYTDEPKEWCATKADQHIAQLRQQASK